MADDEFAAVLADRPGIRLDGRGRLGRPGGESEPMTEDGEGMVVNAQLHWTGAAVRGLWLEDDGIPARVIDELMGHAATRRSSWATNGMSAMGAIYRHTTTEMEARVLKALDTRLALVVGVVEVTR